MEMDRIGQDHRSNDLKLHSIVHSWITLVSRDYFFSLAASAFSSGSSCAEVFSGSAPSSPIAASSSFSPTMPSGADFPFSFAASAFSRGSSYSVVSVEPLVKAIADKAEARLMFYLSLEPSCSGDEFLLSLAYVVYSALLYLPVLVDDRLICSLQNAIIHKTCFCEQHVST